MRVAFVNRGIGLYRGGGEYFDLRIAAALSRLGVDVRFVAGAPLTGDPLPVEGFRTDYCRTPYLRGLSYRLPDPAAGWLLHFDLHWFERAALERLAADPPDVVQALALTRLAPAFELRFGRPAVLGFPGPPDPWDRDRVRSVAGVWANGDAYRVIAERFRDDAVEIPPGVDAALFRPANRGLRDQLGVPPVAPLVLFVGRLVPVKDVPTLLAGFARLRERHPDARLAVVGDGPLRARLEANARRRAPGAVTFAGAVAARELPAWYAAADVVALSSAYENYPNVVIEAFACGRPVVATDVGGMGQLVNGRGRLVPAGDASALAAALEAALSEPEETGRRNRDWVMRDFCWERSARKLLALYENVLRRRRA